MDYWLVGCLNGFLVKRLVDIHNRLIGRFFSWLGQLGVLEGVALRTGELTLACFVSKIEDGWSRELCTEQTEGQDPPQAKGADLDAETRCCE